jgi:hypothetical protein
MRSMARRPRAPSRRKPDAVIEPSGNASAAAISSRSGVSAVIFSGGGIEAMAQQAHVNYSLKDDLRSLVLAFALVSDQQMVVLVKIERPFRHLF